MAQKASTSQWPQIRSIWRGCIHKPQYREWTFSIFISFWNEIKCLLSPLIYWD